MSPCSSTYDAPPRTPVSRASHAGVRARVGGAREPHRVLVEVGGLLRVPDPELDVVPAEQRHEVFGHGPNYDSTGGAIAGRLCQIRSSAMPTKMRTPPMISSGCSVSDRRTSAKNTAKKGCRFPNNDARDGPTRSMAVNQRMFVRKSGPMTA